MNIPSIPPSEPIPWIAKRCDGSASVMVMARFWYEAREKAAVILQRDNEHIFVQTI
jgi:hypothetical protein